MNTTFDFCILGGGVSGIHLAMELLKSGANICLVDPNGLAQGGSGAPLGLANPATGRFASKTWEAERCLNSLKHNLELIQQYSDTKFFKQSGILRPAMDATIAQKMKHNIEHSDWPADWIHWMNQQEIQHFHPGITCVDGGVWIPVGLIVNMEEYVHAASDFLKNKGVTFFTGEPYSIQKTNKWEIVLNAQAIQASQIVFTSGVWTKNIPYWDQLPLIPVKGQLLLMESETPLPFNHAVSALGYIGSLDGYNYVIGSTYEHHFEHKTVDEFAIDYLRTRSERVLPELNKYSKLKAQWTSIRASTPNRKPIMGAHPTEEHCYVFAGLGSKGLLYSAYLAKRMADFMFNQMPLPTEMDVERFLK